MQHSRSFRIRRLTAMAILAAMSTILMLPVFQISLPFLPPFLKYDFSDLPALIGAFAYGPVAGVIIELLKNVIHMPMSSDASIVGELANFLLGAACVLPAGLIYHLRKNKAGAVWGAVSGTVFAGIVSFPVNYLITIPFYAQLYFGGSIQDIVRLYTAICPAADELWKALLIFNLPLTLVKGSINVLITFIIYKKISPLLHGKT